MRNGVMADSQTLQRLTSDPPELRIMFSIQILGWIWGSFLKLGPSTNAGFADDVISFGSACVCGKQRDRKGLMAIT